MDTFLPDHASRDCLLQTYLYFRRSVGRAAGPSATVHENSEPLVDFQFRERFLQIFWNEQRFRLPLHLADGRTLEVLHPGTWNVEPGPDFRRASLRMAGEATTGDVEIHRAPEHWFQHGHERNPEYAHVILHVTWDPPPAGWTHPVPVLVLAPHLPEPWRDLVHDLQCHAYPYARQVAAGGCALRLAAADDALLLRLLRTAGTVRFFDKAERLYQVGVSRGFDQALYEALFAALGYKANQEPMRRLAEAVPLADLRALPDAAAREAALLGTAGMLPDVSRERVARAVRERAGRLWDCWWQQGRSVAGLAWVTHSLRPFNRPERRIAAGLSLLEKTGWHPDRWLGDCARQAGSPLLLRRALEGEMVVSSEWDGAIGFTRALAHPARVLGRNRARDILANVFLPFLYAAARHQGDEAAAELALQSYVQLPRLQSNRRLEEVAHRMLVPPGRIRDVARLAVVQQGFLEIYRDFCEGLDGDCRRCPLSTAAAEPEPHGPPVASPATDAENGDARQLPAACRLKDSSHALPYSKPDANTDFLIHEVCDSRRYSRQSGGTGGSPGEVPGPGGGEVPLHW